MKDNSENRFKSNIREHFDDQSLEILESDGLDSYGSETMNFQLRDPYTYIEEKLLIDLDSKRILDFCCGTGIYSIYPAKHGALVDGLDISPKSIEIAKQRAKHHCVSDRCEFKLCDVEQENYGDKRYDIILIYGSLSYLDIESTFRKLSESLKDQGSLIVIDSLGHNILFNLNRKKNLRNWAAKDVDKLKTIRKDDVFLGNKFFSQIDIKCFNLITAGLYYINRLLGINIRIKPLHKLDELLLKIPIIKWQGFKTVVVYRK